MSVVAPTSPGRALAVPGEAIAALRWLAWELTQRHQRARALGLVAGLLELDSEDRWALELGAHLELAAGRAAQAGVLAERFFVAAQRSGGAAEELARARLLHARALLLGGAHDAARVELRAVVRDPGLGALARALEARDR